MKVKFDSDNYKKNFIENDIALVNKLKNKINDSFIYVILVYAILNTIFSFAVNEFIILSIGISFISLALVFYLHLLTKQYKKNRIFKLLIKNYMMRGIVFIILFLFTIIITIISLPNIGDIKQIWSIIFIIGSLIGAIILLYIDNRYMKIEPLERVALPCITLGLISYLIVKTLGTHVDMFVIVLFVCYILGLSGITTNIIRSIRLLKYAPQDVLDHTE
ncbi:hypothetical protein [Amedibacillus sp. YH-ame10]